MATFRAGKLARRKNGRFQSTAVKSKTGNSLDSRGDVLSRGRAWFAFCFLLNEVGDLSFFDIILFSYSSSLCCKKK